MPNPKSDFIQEFTRYILPVRSRTSHLNTQIHLSRDIRVTLPMAKVKEITKPANAYYVQNSYIGKIKPETIRNCFSFPNLFFSGTIKMA